MIENLRLYNEHGQVEDVVVAKEMAKVEEKYRSQKRLRGLLRPSKKKIAEGERAAEKVGARIIELRRKAQAWEIGDGGAYRGDQRRPKIGPELLNSKENIRLLLRYLLKSSYKTVEELIDDIREINSNILFGPVTAEMVWAEKRRIIQERGAPTVFPLYLYDIEAGGQSYSLVATTDYKNEVTPFIISLRSADHDDHLKGHKIIRGDVESS